MVEDNKDDIKQPESNLGQRIGQIINTPVNVPASTRRETGDIFLPLLLLLLLISRNNFWNGGCGF